MSLTSLAAQLVGPIMLLRLVVCVADDDTFRLLVDYLGLLAWGDPLRSHGVLREELSHPIFLDLLIVLWNTVLIHINHWALRSTAKLLHIHPMIEGAFSTHWNRCLTLL